MALNVTTAVFGENCNTATASPSLAQWDTEQVLQISGIDLPDSYKVEFSTVYTRNAIPAIGDASGVTIPNVLLQRSAPITAYVVLYGENGGRNREYWITIHITPGQPPETITPDPEQADVIDEAIAALNNGVAKAEAAAGEAEAASQAVQDMDVEAETLAAGSAASVEKTVDPETGAVTLNFGIPKGDTGATGPQGPQGVQGPKGDTGDPAIVYSIEPSVSAVKYNPNAAVGSKFTPRTLWLYTYKTVRGVKFQSPVDYLEVNDGEYIIAQENTSSISASMIDPYQGPATVITFTAKVDNAVVAKITVPIVSDGATGPQGPKGDTGATGPQGPQGPKGDAGASDAGEVTYDPAETYQSGTAGAALNDLSRQLSDTKSELVIYSDNAVETVKSDLDLVATFESSANIVRFDTAVVGLVNPNTGVIDSSRTYYKTTDYIPISMQSYYVDYMIGTTHSSAESTTIAFYDKFFNIVSTAGFVRNSPFSFTVTNDNVAYMRICCPASRMTGGSGSYNLIVIVGTDAPTRYVAYNRSATLNAISQIYGDDANKVPSLKLFTDKMQPFDNYDRLIGTSVTVEEDGAGFIIYNGGVNTSGTSYRRSKPIAFSAGDYITVRAIGRDDGQLSLLSVVRTGKTKFQRFDPKIIPTVSTAATYNYYVTEDCDIVFSWHVSGGITVTKLSNSAFNSVLGGTLFSKVPAAIIDRIPTHICCFSTITCIGDSLTQGVFNTSSGSIIVPKYSYPSALKRHTGVDTINLGIGSMCASTQQANDSWFDRAGQDPYNYLVSSNVGDAVIVALGTNDITMYGSFIGDVSTDIDVTDRTNNAQNSVGGYANIIQWCKEQNPNVKVFCVTISNVRNDAPASAVTERNAANEKIKAIADLLGCYVLDLAGNFETTFSDQQYFKSTYVTGSHNNALGYELRARQYAAMVDYTIEQHIDDFYNIQFIGTNYDYTT